MNNMNNKIEDKEFEKLEDPTEEDLHSPLFESIWQSIKKWDIERDYGLGRAGATGTDVKTIMNAVESYLLSRDQALLEVVMKDVGEMKKTPPAGNSIPFDWGVEDPETEDKRKGYNQALDDILSLLKDYKINK